MSFHLNRGANIRSFKPIPKDEIQERDRCNMCTERTIIEEASKKLKHLQSRGSSVDSSSFIKESNENATANVVLVNKCLQCNDESNQVQTLFKNVYERSSRRKKRAHTLSLSNNVIEKCRSQLHFTQSVPIDDNNQNTIKKSHSLRSKNDLSSQNQSFLKKYFQPFKEKNSKSLDTLFGNSKSKEDFSKLVETHDDTKSSDVLSAIRDTTEITDLMTIDDDLSEIIIPGDRNFYPKK